MVITEIFLSNSMLVFHSLKKRINSFSSHCPSHWRPKAHFLLMSLLLSLKRTGSSFSHRKIPSRLVSTLFFNTSFCRLQTKRGFSSLFEDTFTSLVLHSVFCRILLLNLSVDIDVSPDGFLWGMTQNETWRRWWNRWHEMMSVYFFLLFTWNTDVILMMRSFESEMFLSLPSFPVESIRFRHKQHVNY